MADAETTKIVLFKGAKVRRTLHDGEWWFSVVDAIEALTDTSNPNDYWYRMKTRVKEEDKIELSTICRQLKVKSADGKKYETDCATTEGLFRIVQSFHLRKLSRSSGGWRKLDMSGCKK